MIQNLASKRYIYNIERMRLVQQVKHARQACEPNSAIDLHRALRRASQRRKRRTRRHKGSVRLVPEDGSRKIGISSGLRIAHECLIGRPLLIPRRVKRFAAPAALKESGTAGRSGVHESTEHARDEARAKTTTTSGFFRPAMSETH